MDRLLTYTKEDVARVKRIEGRSATAWNLVEGTCPDAMEHVQTGPDTEPEISADMHNTTGTGEARICLGTDCVLALVPPTTRRGDVVVQFPHCSAAAVMRPIGKGAEGPSGGSFNGPAYALVGKADVAGAHDSSFLSALMSRDAVLVEMDVRALQILSASTVAF